MPPSPSLGEGLGVRGDDGAPAPTRNRPSAATRRLTATRVGLAVVSLVALVGFAVYAAFLASQADEETAPVPITVPSQGAGAPLVGGNVAPDFTLPTLDGRNVSLSDYRGRPVWINVWASWCAPCRAEMPDIDTVYQEAAAKGPGADKGLALLLVSIGEDPAPVRRYVDTTKLQLPILVDPDFAITAGYRITGLPTHYFIGADGTIKDLHIGPLKPATMRAKHAKITS